MPGFGLQIPNFSFGVPDEKIFERVAELATGAEGAGFDSVWVMDHFWQLPPLGGPTQPMLEAYTLLGAIGARTSRVNLGALVTGVTYRNPALVAKIVTTLDVITAGRAMLGIGAAWYEPEHVGLGFDFPPARERLDRLEEAVQICRLMFREHAPTFKGTHYRIEETLNVPRPVRPGGPPIMIGGGGEKRTLRIVAEHADMCNVFGDPEVIRHKATVLRKHCEDLGRDPSEVTFSRLGTLVPTKTAAETASMREQLSQVAGAESAAGFVIGTDAEIVDQVAELAEAGVQYFIFNLPLSDVATVSRIGTLLTTNLA